MRHSLVLLAMPRLQSTLQGIRCRRVFADPAGLYDPQSSSWISLPEGADQGLHQVEGDQAAVLGRTDIDECAVTGRAHVLLGHCCDIVTGLAQTAKPALAQIFVELEPHAVFFTGMSTNRSRDISAP